MVRLGLSSLLTSAVPLTGPFLVVCMGEPLEGVSGLTTSSSLSITIPSKPPRPCNDSRPYLHNQKSRPLVSPDKHRETSLE